MNSAVLQMKHKGC